MGTRAASRTVRGRSRRLAWIVLGGLLSGGMSGCVDETLSETTGLSVTSWNGTPEALALQTDVRAGKSRHFIPGMVLIGCMTDPSESGGMWFAARALRRTGGPDFDPTYEPASQWFRWENLDCPHRYNLTLKADYTFQLARIKVYCTGDGCREVSEGVVPVASRY